MHSGEKLNKVGLPLGLASIPKHCSIRLQKTFQNAQWKRKKSETNATKICDGVGLDDNDVKVGLPLGLASIQKHCSIKTVEAN